MTRLTRNLRPQAAPAPDTECYPFLLPPVEPDELGRLGGYRVLRLLGQGGMGLVFHAEDLALRRPVALKVLSPEMDDDGTCRQRFLREARALAALRDPAVVTVYHAGQEGETAYLVMELLEGATLQDCCANGPLPPADVLRLARDIAAGLAVIHRHGLVHRDLKPANLWREAGSGRVKILDFGLARFVAEGAALTHAGGVVGTPAFMSPEQARGGTVDARSDLFSFGAVLYRLCTGCEPFGSENTFRVLTALAVADPRPVEQLNAAVPPALAELILQLLAKEPHARPASAEEVLVRLAKIEDPGAAPAVPCAPAVPGKETTSRRRRWARWALVAALAAAVALLVTRTSPSESDRKAAAQAERDAVAPAAPAPVKTFLSELRPVSWEHWPFLPPPPPGQPPIEPLGGVTVGGQASPHGIFMHPPPAHQGQASLGYRLAGAYARFHAEVSLNDGPGEAYEPVTFAVHGDGRLLWQSRPLRRQHDAQTCALAVEGVDRLTLAVSSAGDPFGAHAVWVEPYVEK